MEAVDENEQEQDDIQVKMRKTLKNMNKMRDAVGVKRKEGGSHDKRNSCIYG